MQTKKKDWVHQKSFSNPCKGAERKGEVPELLSLRVAEINEILALLKEDEKEGC